MDRAWIYPKCFGLVMAAGLLAPLANGGPAEAQPTMLPIGAPPVGDIIMPSVTPEQAAHYLNGRAIPQAQTAPSSRPSPAADQVRAAPTGGKIEVAPVLGHELPTGETTSSGFRRADFAIGSRPPGSIEPAALQTSARQGAPRASAVGGALSDAISRAELHDPAVPPPIGIMTVPGLPTSLRLP